MYNKERVEQLLKQPKTEDAVNELVELNTGLLRKQLYKFGMINDQDAWSYGYEALYKAIISYEPERNHRFSTYATVCIYNRLGSHARSLNTNILTNTVYYEEPLQEGFSMLDTLESSQRADHEILQECGVAEIRGVLTDCYYDMTNPVKANIVALWINSDFTLTQVNIADTVGCSQTYVAQVIKQFRSEIKRKLEEY